LNLAAADHTVRHAEQEEATAIHLADRDLAIALAGLGLRRWQNLMAATATIATPADGCDLVHAHRHAEEIEAAISRRTAVGMWHGARVSAAKAARREAQRALRQIAGPDQFV
jgi:hypothetical protein